MQEYELERIVARFVRARAVSNFIAVQRNSLPFAPQRQSSCSFHFRQRLLCLSPRALLREPPMNFLFRFSEYHFHWTRETMRYFCCRLAWKLIAQLIIFFFRWNLAKIFQSRCIFCFVFMCWGRLGEAILLAIIGELFIPRVQSDLKIELSGVVQRLDTRRCSRFINDGPTLSADLSSLQRFSGSERFDRFYRMPALTSPRYIIRSCERIERKHYAQL